MKQVGDTSLGFERNPVAVDFEVANEYGTDEFEKYRLKSKSATVDVALMNVEEEEVEEQVENRKDDFRDLEIRVPSPYTAEIESKDQDEDYGVEFHDGENGVYGLAYADPEYKLMIEEQDRIPRYRYYLTWKYFPEKEKLAEIEVYVSKEEFEMEAVGELAESLVLR